MELYFIKTLTILTGTLIKYDKNKTVAKKKAKVQTEAIDYFYI